MKNERIYMTAIEAHDKQKYLMQLQRDNEIKQSIIDDLFSVLENYNPSHADDLRDEIYKRYYLSKRKTRKEPLK